jgi:hypothetical protein
MKRRSFPLLVLAAGVAVLALTGSAAYADVSPPTLSGEEFVDPAPTITATCNASGTSTISFSSSGLASGPYTGTFTEVGTATIGPQSFDTNGTPLGSVLTFDAVFTIDSPTGDVIGTKTLGPITNPGTQFANGQCADSQGGDPVELISAIIGSAVRYEAEISAPEGEFADRGGSPIVSLQRLTNVGQPTPFFQEFFENFASDLGATQPLNTPGQATGGGQIPGDVTFGLTAKSDQKGIKATCTLIDRATRTAVRCLDASTYTQTGTHAVFRGNALVNGVATTYRVSVDDNGEPGEGLDTFTLSTDLGYGASGVLSEGNIQIHA